MSYSQIDLVEIKKLALHYYSWLLRQHGWYSSYPQYDLFIIPEESGFNNTLSPEETCEPREAASAMTEALVMVVNMMKSAIKRFAAFLPDDFGLSLTEVLGMLSLCPYEYASLGSSSFCSLFTEQEWRDFEYLHDPEFYDAYGFSSYNGTRHRLYPRVIGTAPAQADYEQR